MPIYVYKCSECGVEEEKIETLAQGEEPHFHTHDGPGCFLDRSFPAARIPQAASFGFKTKGGNFASFSPSHGPVTRGNRRPKVIGRGRGLGGHRPPASPKSDPEFRERVVKMIAERGARP